MNNVFTYCENGKTPDLHRLLLNLSDEIKLKRSKKSVPLSSNSIYYYIHGQIQKSHTKTIKLKYQLYCQMKIYLMIHILIQIFQIISSISLKDMDHQLISLQWNYI